MLTSLSGFDGKGRSCAYSFRTGYRAGRPAQGSTPPVRGSAVVSPGAKPPRARRRELRTLEPQLRPHHRAHRPSAQPRLDVIFTVLRQAAASPSRNSWRRSGLYRLSRVLRRCGPRGSSGHVFAGVLVDRLQYLVRLRVLGSSMRSAATNSPRLVLAPRTSSNESLTAFASPLSTKEIIHWRQSSRAMMVRWSRSLASQSRRGPLTVHLGRRRQTRSGPVRPDELRRSLPIVRA